MENLCIHSKCYCVYWLGHLLMRHRRVLGGAWIYSVAICRKVSTESNCCNFPHYACACGGPDWHE